MPRPKRERVKPEPGVGQVWVPINAPECPIVIYTMQMNVLFLIDLRDSPGSPIRWDTVDHFKWRMTNSKAECYDLDDPEMPPESKSILTELKITRVIQ